MISMKRGKLVCLGCNNKINWYQHKWHSEQDILRLAELSLEQIPGNAEEANRSGNLECPSCGYINNIHD